MYLIQHRRSVLENDEKFKFKLESILLRHNLLSSWFGFLSFGLGREIQRVLYGEACVQKASHTYLSTELHGLVKRQVEVRMC